MRPRGKRRECMQCPQRIGHPNQRFRHRKGYSLHKIGDGKPFVGANITSGIYIAIEHLLSARRSVCARRN